MVLWFWIIILAGFFGFFYWATGVARQNEANEKFDTGLAILEFGRAYPNEAIRSLVISADGEMVFLRLWDGGTGCMRRNGSRFTCTILDPAVINIVPTPDGRGLTIEHNRIKAFNGTFVFRNAREAAEVSLWLLGSLTSHVTSGEEAPPPRPA